jgi:hypothetical protein
VRVPACPGPRAVDSVARHSRGAESTNLVIKLAPNHGAPLIDTSGTGGGFVHDIKASLSAWSMAIPLPVLTALLSAFPDYLLRPLIGSWTTVIGLGLGFISLGWLGTQLIWYQRVFEGRGVRPREVIPLTWSFIARYFRLFSLLVFAILILVIPFALLERPGFESLRSTSGRVVLIVFFGVVQVAGTFILPALAYSTSKVRKAIPIGFKMLVSGWPGNWMYVVVPAALGGAIAGVSWLVPPLGQAGLGIIGALVLLACTGAVARYYLRSKTADGAAPFVQSAI